MTTQGWFSVRILFESLRPQEQDAPQFFEERILLVQAESEDAAREKATERGHAGEQEYQNANGKLVQDVFREVLDVVEIDDEIGDCAEVYYQFLNADEVDSIRRSLEPGSADRRWPVRSKAGR